jgi:hypothetical protein
LAHGIGHKCGAIYVDLGFKNWLRHLIGEQYYRQLDPKGELGKVNSHKLEGEGMRDLMRKFDIIKRNFKRDGRDRKLDLPDPLENLDLPGTVKEGEITIPQYVVSFCSESTNKTVMFCVTFSTFVPTRLCNW